MCSYLHNTKHQHIVLILVAHCQLERKKSSEIRNGLYMTALRTLTCNMQASGIAVLCATSYAPFRWIVWQLPVVALNRGSGGGAIEPCTVVPCLGPQPTTVKTSENFDAFSNQPTAVFVTFN